MPLARQLIPHRMADALCALLSQKHTTAKQMARAYKIDPATAENLRKGHLSVPTLEKVVKAEGWGLWAELGREMTGESYADYLHRITQRQADEQREREAQRDRIRTLETQAIHMGHLPRR